MRDETVVKTPCIGICSTTSVGDSICRGCKRFSREVIDWNGYESREKRAVLQRIDQLVRQIMAPRFIIDSVDSLQTGMRGQGVPVHPELSPYAWLHNLLKKRHNRLQSLADFGVRCRAPYDELPLNQLWEQLDEELIALCEAHRQRYFPADLPGLRAMEA